nr:MAG TPA: hypothetical protein [Caudoviricetes sp.]
MSLGILTGEQLHLLIKIVKEGGNSRPLFAPDKSRLFMILISRFCHSKTMFFRFAIVQLKPQSDRVPHADRAVHDCTDAQRPSCLLCSLPRQHQHQQRYDCNFVPNHRGNAPHQGIQLHAAAP